MMQGGFARADGVACFGPNFRLDATAAYRARYFAVFEEKHFGAPLLRRGAARTRDRGNYDSLAEWNVAPRSLYPKCPAVPVAFLFSDARNRLQYQRWPRMFPDACGWFP